MITVYTDGGARGNPGPAAIGVVIQRENHEPVLLKKFLGISTNNVAEYRAVIEAFTLLLQTPQEERGEVSFLLDSLLVVQQLKGLYKVKDIKLQPLWNKVKEQMGEWGRQVTFSHIPRAQNAKADKLVNEALDEKKDK